MVKRVCFLRDQTCALEKRKEKKERKKEMRKKKEKTKAGPILNDVIEFTLISIFLQLYLKSDQGLVNYRGI